MLRQIKFSHSQARLKYPQVKHAFQIKPIFQTKNFQTKKLLRTSFIYPLAIFVYLLNLTGCVSHSNLPQTNWATHSQALTQLTSYSASGKMSFKDPQNKQSLNFNYQQTPKTTQLKLINFLGQTELTLNIDKNGAHAKLANGQQFSNASANQLINQLTGSQLPIEQLQDWLKGLPTDATQYQLNSNNRLKSFSYEENNQTWQLEYGDYQTFAQSSKPSLGLPIEIDLKQAQTQVHLEIRTWRF